MYSQTTATNKIVEIANSGKKVLGVQGGTSASKTISILLYLIALAQSDKTPTLTSIVSESMPHLKKGAMRDFFSILKKHHYWAEKNWNATDKIYTFETGSQIEFFGAESGDKLRGGRRDRLFINEANNVPFEAFEELEVRTKEFCFLDWNPTNEFWFNYYVLNHRTDVAHIILTYKDNEALSQSIIDSIEQRKERKSWWQVYGLGLLGEIETRIYTGWDIIPDIPMEARLIRRGLDFGYTNDPTAVIALYAMNGAFYIDQEIYLNGMSNKMIADRLLSLDEPKTLIKADGSEPKSIDEISSYGLNIIRALKGADSVRHGIQMIQDQKIFITSRSVEMIKEYRNYLWRTDRDGKVLKVPEDGNDHALDALRYAFDELKIHSFVKDFRSIRTVDPITEMLSRQNSMNKKKVSYV